jgi:hypothetical protein
MLLAVLFLGSGLLTYQIYYWVAKTSYDYQLILQLLTGLPFGVVCGLRFVRPRKWLALAVLLDCITWVAAYRFGLALSPSLNPFAGMALAGLVGGLGVMASTGLGCRILYSRQPFAGAALIGGIAGIPFGLVLNRSAQENLILAMAFPLWQVAIGLWIWISSERSDALHLKAAGAQKL